MNSDTSWYEEGRSHFKNQPSTSGAQRGRPPDHEPNGRPPDHEPNGRPPDHVPKEEKPNTNNIIEAVSLVDDEDDPEEAINSFHSMTRTQILLPLTGVEIQEELKFVEAIKQFKMILEKKVEVLTLRRNLKEMLYKYLLFFGTNYGRIAILYKDQYLDVMEDILLLYCDVIKEFFRDQKNRKRQMKVIQEARRIKILLRDCLLRKMDRILHVLLKVRLAPELEEYGRLWGDVYMYFLTKVSYKLTDEDILRGFIAFQKFKTIRVKSEWAMIDKVMLELYKKSADELRRIPCLGEIMDRMKRDRLYTVRDMLTRYMRYYKEKRSQTERFEMDDFDEDTGDAHNVNDMRRLDLSNSFPSIQSRSISDSPAAQIFTDRRKGVRKTVLDMAAEPNPQFDQCSTEFSLFDDDVAKKEIPEESVVILDDEDDDDDVIVVCHNLRNVITIDDDDDDEAEPVRIQPTSSSCREALSPEKILFPPDAQSSSNTTTQMGENEPPNQLEQIDTSPPLNILTSQSSPPILTETDVENAVPENMLLKEPSIPKNTPLSAEIPDNLIPKNVQVLKTHVSKRLVKKVDNSLRITINSLPSSEQRLDVPSLRIIQDVPAERISNERSSLVEFVQLPSEKSSRLSGQLTETRLPDTMENTPTLVSDESVLEKEKSVLSSEAAEIFAPKTAFVPPSSDVEIESCPPQKPDPVIDERLLSKTVSVPVNLNKLLLEPEFQEMAEPESGKNLQLSQPMEICEVASNPSVVADQLLSEERSSIEKSVAKIDLSDTDESQNQQKNSSSEMDSSSLGITSESSGSVVNSTMIEETVSLMNMTSISPISKDMKPPNATKRIGVLPSSKVPSDLDDSPDSSPDKTTEKYPRPYTISETSNISSPSFESIDKVEAKKFFEGQKTGGRVSSSSNETETSNTSCSSNKSSAMSVTEAEASGHITAESSVNISTTVDADSEITANSDTNSLEESNDNTQENTVIQVENANKSHNLNSAKELIKPCENKAGQDEQEPFSNSQTPDTIEKALEAKSCNVSQKPLRKPRNYSNLTECFTKFTEELSVEDILTSHSEDLASSTENLALPMIDLVSSTDNPTDVIIVKCRPIEPLKDEEDIVSGSETIAFSTDEVLAPSNEPVALLVTFPGSSQEESQHFLMCDANVALADEQLAFTSGEMISEGDDPTISVNQQVLDTDLSVPLPEVETIDGLSLSGSQPYTPQSSPSTRIEAVRHDDSSEPGAANNQILSTPYQKPTIIVAIPSNDENSPDKAPKHTEKGSKRKKSTDISLKPSKSRRKSCDSTKEEICKQAEKTDTKKCDTRLKPADITVEDFREDLSQSVTSAKRVTPQEVDKISQLPFRYSQPLWSDHRPQQKTEVPRADLLDKHVLDKPIPAKVPLQKIALPQNASDQLQTSSNALPQQNVKISKPDMTLLSPLEKQVDESTRSASFVEEKIHELYMKEYGNNLSQPDLSQPRLQSKRKDFQEAPPVRPVKIYSKERHTKDLPQPNDRDLSLKSYKSLIKGVSKRRTSVSRDSESLLQKEEVISHLPSKNLKAFEDIASQQKGLRDSNKGASSQEANIYDHSEFFNNGIEGPIGKPLVVGTDVEDNFFWDSDNCDNDVTKDDAFSGTISVKPDSQLFQARKGAVSVQKNLVSSSKSSRSKTENDSSDQKSPEKKKVTFANKSEMRLYVKLAPIDKESYERDLKRANELKKKQRQISLAQEMREKRQQPLQRDQILIQIYSEKSGPSRWFTKARAKLTAPPVDGDRFSAHSHVSSIDESNFMKGKAREQADHRNGHKLTAKRKSSKAREQAAVRNGHKLTEKRKIRDFEPEVEVHRKKIAVSADLITGMEKPKNPTPNNGKIIASKLKPNMKPVKESPPASSKGFAIEGNDILEAAPSSPIKTTKSGRVCKKLRPDYNDVIKGHFNGSRKVKKTVTFKL